MGEGGRVAGSDGGLPSLRRSLVGGKGLAAPLGSGPSVRGRGSFEDVLSQFGV